MVKANKLTQLQATRLKEPGLHGDGAGLWLKVTEGGSKSWILRYAFNGRERWTGLGPYPEVSLADARDKAMAWRRQVRQGIDPMQVKHQAAAVARAEQAKTITFDSCAERYIESHRSGWKNAKHADQWTNTLQTYAAPIIGKMDVALIETAHIMRCLNPCGTPRQKPPRACGAVWKLCSIGPPCTGTARETTPPAGKATSTHCCLHAPKLPNQSTSLHCHGAT